MASATRMPPNRGEVLCRDEFGLSGGKRLLLFCQFLRKVHELYVLSQTEQLEHANAEVIQINFIPSESMASRDRVRVMIVVPSLAERHHCNPPVIGGIVL